MENKCYSPVSDNLKSEKKINDSSAIASEPSAKFSTSSACPVKPQGDSSAIETRQIAKSSAPTTSPVKPHGKAVASSVNSNDSSAISSKPTGKGIVSSANGCEVLVFRDVSLGPHEAELRFQLVHSWEARNPHSKTLIGLEMLLIDQEGTAIQGFIPASRVELYMPHMVAGSIYKLRKFFGSRSKDIFRVADHDVTVSFSWNSVLTVLEDSPVRFLEDRFRFHTHEEFEANCGLKADLYDYVGHMKLVNGQSMTEHPILDEVVIAEKRHLVVHIQTHDGQVMKLYLWDQAATAFCQKFKSYGRTPRVLLVTTVSPKRLGGTLALGSMTSSRVFMDTDVQPTRDYLTWLGSNPDVANKANAHVVTKPEAVTLEALFSYIKQENSKTAWFECTATIYDVLHGSPWYYISCGGCNSKVTKGATSLICTNKRCGKTEVTGVPQYLTKITVYDKTEQAVFVLLGDAGRELTGKHASELVASYFEGNEDVGAEQTVPVPQTLMSTIGQTHKFVVKVSDHNLTGKTQTITVTKVLPVEAPQNSIEDLLDEKIRKATGSVGSQEPKRAKSG